jgi:hypothetical protein
MRSGRCALLALVLAVLLPASARADLVAAVVVNGDRADIAILNTTTGARRTLPASVNSAALEGNPSVSADGKRLAFERADLAAGTHRIVVVDLATGQSSDLFTAFDTAQSPQYDPFISADGTAVYTGGNFDQPRPPAFSPRIVLTSLAPFPAGPYSHASLRPEYDFAVAGTTLDPDVSGSLIAFQERRGQFPGELILRQAGGAASSPLARASMYYRNPTMAATNPQVVVFDQAPVNADQSVGQSDLAFAPANVSTFTGSAPVKLPAIVDSPLSESDPALTADGRYLAFVRHADGHDRLFMFDTQTQTLLNPDGVDLGTMDSSAIGNISFLPTTPLIVTSMITSTGTISAQLLRASGVGIIVQRIRGRHRLLGKRVFKLGPLRRVPLGRFRKGPNTVHWNLKVGGHRLAPGRYLVTPRAVTPKVVVRELGKPRVIRIRKR